MGHVEVLYTLHEIERALGYAPGALRSIRAKGMFPAPDQQYGRTPLWRKETIDQWAITRRRGMQ